MINTQQREARLEHAKDGATESYQGGFAQVAPHPARYPPDGLTITPAASSGKTRHVQHPPWAVPSMLALPTLPLSPP